MHDSSWLLIGILVVVPALSLLARAIRVPYPIVLALAMDSTDSELSPQVFVDLGIQPKSALTYIADVAQTLIRT